MQIAVLSSARWSSFRLSKHFIAQALAQEGHDVVYVDPPVSPGSVLRSRQRVVDLLAFGDEVVSPSLRVWRPTVLPGQNSRLVQPVNARLLRRGLERRLPDLDLSIAFSLESRGLLRTSEGRRVYYCTDSLEDSPGADSAKVRSREQDLVEASDLVVACSLPLRDQLEARGCRPLYLPHACDDGALLPPGPVPPELVDLPRPLVGYVGSLNFRIDVSLLEAARRAAGHGTLVIIGGGFGPAPTAATIALLRQPGLVALGHRPIEALPTYMAALDVGIVPYTAEPFNRKSFPIKVLQYLASGIPVVSSTNGATDELGDHVSVADSPEAFEMAVREAIDDDDARLRQARREFAASRRWQDVAAALLDRLDTVAAEGIEGRRHARGASG